MVSAAPAQTFVESTAEPLAMIGVACASLGEQALVCAGWSRFSNVRHSERVEVVGSVAEIICLGPIPGRGLGDHGAGQSAGTHDDPDRDPGC